MERSALARDSAIVCLGRDAAPPESDFGTSNIPRTLPQMKKCDEQVKIRDEQASGLRVELVAGL